MTPVKYLSALLFFLAMACSTPRQAHPGDGHAVKRNFGPGVLHISASYQAAYCGGADPGLDYPRPHPWRGIMYLRRARPDSTGKFAINELDIPISDSLRTDGLGQGVLELPAGTYLLWDRDRVDNIRYRQLLNDHGKPTLHTQPIDMACMQQWLYGPFGVVTITSGDTTHVDLPFFGRCPWDDTPCVHYLGPYPP